MSIVGADPLELLLYQQGQIGPPLTTGPAAGADNLDSAQRSITIGEPVPIVFGRRRDDGTGGVLISPGASECRFTNSLTNEVTAYYRLVLSEGELDGIQVRDVFQRSCRVGSFSQAYELRAGTWAPGNFIVERVGLPKPEASYYCGTGGSYEGMTTASFQITAPADDTRWDRQVHLFVRGGMKVTRLLDSIYGPSDNFADLTLWLIRQTSRVPAALIDLDAFEAAAAFTDNTELRFNAWIRESSNLEDFLATYAPYLLLSKSKRGGKIGLRPLLPTTVGDEIDTGTITPVTLFDESRVVPDSFEISWVPLAERKPVCLQMLWRQQPEDDLGLIRTTEVRYVGTAADGPYEQHDLSAFATSELHAVRVGAYILARRRYVSHTLRIRARPSTINQQLSRGDIVQVRLQRTASSAAAGEHNYLYEVDRIGKARNGELSFDLVHFPIDATGRSLVALDVMAATASGVLLPTGKAEAVTCDVNDAADETVPTDGTLAPVDISEEFGDGVGSGLEAGGDPFSGGDFPDVPIEDGGGSLDGGGVGGGSGGSPGDGTEEGEDAADVQEVVDTSGPPQGVAVGQSLPAGFLTELNADIANKPAGVAHEFDWSKWEVSEWTVTVVISPTAFGSSTGAVYPPGGTYTITRVAGGTDIRQGYEVRGGGSRTIYGSIANYVRSINPTPGAGGPYVAGTVGSDIYASGGTTPGDFYDGETISITAATRTA
jgi:hypothetical protein